MAFRRHLGLHIIVGLALAIRLVYAWQPASALIAQGASDDAFYYLQIARNLAAGNGASFDGLAPTNGFHPLYLLMLTPLFRFFPNDLDRNLQLAFSLLMVFNVLTAYPLYGTITALWNEKIWPDGKVWAGLVAVVAWLFNPWVLIISLGGVESGVYIFFVALSVYLLVKHQISPQPGHLSALLGLSLGLTILARSDGVLLLFAVILAFLLGRPAERGGVKGWISADRVLSLAIAVGMSGLLLAPWLTWNLTTFGTVVQVSGASIFRHTHGDVPSTWLTVLRILFENSVRHLLMIAVMLFQLCFSILLVGVMRSLPRYRRIWATAVRPARSSSGSTTSLNVVFLYAFLIFAFYAWFLWQRQLWYFMPILFVAALAAGLLYRAWIVMLKPGPTITNVTSAFILGFFFLSFAFGWWVWRQQIYVIYPLERNAIQLAGWLSRQTESGARIGAWNAGILGYFSQRQIVNLDGVVNNDLYTYVREKGISFDDLNGLHDYLIANRVDYVTDFADVIVDAGLPFLRLVHSFPSAYGNFDVRVFRVTP